MNLKNTILGACAIVALAGCSNTAEGVKKDSEENGQKTSEQAQNMGKGASDAGKGMAAATMLTPKIKLAITANKELNASTNLINVNSTGDKVTLEGHVTSEELKTLAGDIAQKAMKDSDASQTLTNSLEVKK